MIVPCECGAKLKIDDAKISAQGIRVRCPRCGNVLAVLKPEAMPAAVAPPPNIEQHPGRATGPLVLVAHDSDAVRDSIASVLHEAGYAVDSAGDGNEALKKAVENRPQAMVLDVGLPGIYGFELCERLKGSGETNGIKIILLSSVYDMKRYKRTPVSLYGADDYIEKHHIPDFLPEKLQKLLSPSSDDSPPGSRCAAPSVLPEMSRPPAREFQPSLLKADRSAVEERVTRASSPPAPAARPTSAANEAAAAITPESFSLEASIFQKEECDIPRVDEADPEAVEKARRFARIIVSDIALYNQESVAEGLKNGTFYVLLKADVEEGRELYENRVPQSIRSKNDYYQEAFDNFINAQEKPKSRDRKSIEQ